ncbi:MAG: colanic acid biosynthesis glycosyltransferase WcaL [Gammaproteobacteria bacterium]|nr:MAG: colanic acid biosynthesis glycosyltransferase WcaL [Gammaproteobacteria bacterium]RKZ44737.1 MAG: colanic acid biosynthesis glycosyltransferase WcaL [Gammaproteobacteria bacterium]RKZ73255.1 MAG: colanic acid biosynthesis glycosyltransferase WcaL [Gammaproteobacteria bacterium]
MKTIRMAYLISQYPAISHTFILREIRILRHKGFDIKVASINTPDRSLDKLTTIEREEAQNTYYVKSHGLMGSLKAHVYTLLTQPLGYIRGLFFALSLGKFDLKKILYGFFYFVEAVMIGHWMRHLKLSHLHVHIPMAAASVGLIANRAFPITFSMTVHGPNEFYDTPGNDLTQKILDAGFICCISHFARSQLMALSPPTVWDKLEVSRLGVDPEIFAPPSYREQTNFCEVLCIGRLVPVKGQFILIEAVARLIAQSAKIRLRLVGDGPDRQRLEETVKERKLTEHIIFEGAVNQEHILDFYASADIFALASFAEGLPIVLMEAMAMEIPCITTHITGIPELITSGKNGILVAASDIEALSDAISLLINKPDLRHQIGQAGRQRILEGYELQKNTESLADIFCRRLC